MKFLVSVFTLMFFSGLLATNLYAATNLNETICEGCCGGYGCDGAKWCCNMAPGGSCCNMCTNPPKCKKNTKLMDATSAQEVDGVLGGETDENTPPKHLVVPKTTNTDVMK